MPLRKAIDDLRQTTLSALPGRWLKLLYFAKLRRPAPGKYSHWGFEQKYGKEAASAFSEAHQGVVRETLRVPISELLEDAEKNIRDVDNLSDSAGIEVLPGQLSHESESHFRYVLASVKALLLAKKSR